MKDTVAIYEELGLDRKWHKAFTSECFYKAKHNRLRFTVPLLSLFTLAFLGLFTVQSYLKAIGQIPVVGYVDVGFLLVMSLFPITGLLGIAFAKYTEKYVYPYEDQVIRSFGSASEIAELNRNSEEAEENNEHSNMSGVSMA